MSRLFELIVRAPNGPVRVLEISASDATAARAQAMRDGLHVMACTSRMNSIVRRQSARLGGRFQIDIATFSHELASLLIAGLSVVDALRTLAENQPAGPRRAAVLEVVERVGQGLPLSVAMERAAGRFPPLLVATIGASERTGDLPSALMRYASNQQNLRALRDKVTGAAVYPLLLLIVGCLVALFLLGVVVPKFAVLIESTRRELPWSSQLLMGWGRWVAGHAVGAVIAVVAGLVAAAVFVRHLIRHGGRLRWVEAVPLIGSTIRQFRQAQLYRTTGMLVKGGIAAPRALQLGASLLGVDDSARITRAVALLHEGRSLSDALRQVQLADPVATSMLAVAERTGALAEILERIATFHEGRVQRSVELTSRLFEPLLMIVIGLVIGSIVVLMYLPIFDLASSLQ